MTPLEDQLAEALRRAMRESSDVPAGYDVDSNSWWGQAHHALAAYDQTKRDEHA